MRSAQSGTTEQSTAYRFDMAALSPAQSRIWAELSQRLAIDGLIS